MRTTARLLASALGCVVAACSPAPGMPLDGGERDAGQPTCESEMRFRVGVDGGVVAGDSIFTLSSTPWCFEPGDRLTITVVPSAVFTLAVNADSAPLAITIERAGVPLFSGIATPGNPWRRWLYSGTGAKVTITLSADAGTFAASYVVTHTEVLGTSFILPGEDGGVLERSQSSPSAHPEDAPTYVSETTSDALGFGFSMAAALNDWLIPGECSQPGPLPERYYAMTRQTAEPLFLNHHVQKPFPRQLRALHTDGGVIASETYTDPNVFNARLQVNLTGPERVVVGMKHLESGQLQTCGTVELDGGSAPSFYFDYLTGDLSSF